MVYARERIHRVMLLRLLAIPTSVLERTIRTEASLGFAPRRRIASHCNASTCSLNRRPTLDVVPTFLRFDTGVFRVPSLQLRIGVALATGLTEHLHEFDDSHAAPITEFR